MPVTPTPPVGMTKHGQMFPWWGWGVAKLSEVAQKTVFPIALHSVFLQWTVDPPDRWSPLCPLSFWLSTATLTPEGALPTPSHTFSDCLPKIKHIPPSSYLPQHAVSLMPATCHETFALYLPTICPLSRSLPNVLLLQEKTHFHSVFPFGFVYMCFFRQCQEDVFILRSLWFCSLYSVRFLLYLQLSKAPECEHGDMLCQREDPTFKTPTYKMVVICTEWAQPPSHALAPRLSRFNTPPRNKERHLS